MVMNAQATETREALYERVRRLSDRNVGLVLEYIDDLEEHEPNAETVAAMKDVVERKNLSEAYDDVKEMMKDLIGV